MPAKPPVKRAPAARAQAVTLVLMRAERAPAEPRLIAAAILPTAITKRAMAARLTSGRQVRIAEAVAKPLLAPRQIIRPLASE